jgi:hypothetical protein
MNFWLINTNKCNTLIHAPKWSRMRVIRVLEYSSTYTQYSSSYSGVDVKCNTRSKINGHVSARVPGTRILEYVCSSSYPGVDVDVITFTVLVLAIKNRYLSRFWLQYCGTEKVAASIVVYEYVLECPHHSSGEVVL